MHQDSYQPTKDGEFIVRAQNNPLPPRPKRHDATRRRRTADPVQSAPREWPEFLPAIFFYISCYASTAPDAGLRLWKSRPSDSGLPAWNLLQYVTSVVNSFFLNCCLGKTFSSTSKKEFTQKK
jgi:hypothetical protein